MPEFILQGKESPDFQELDEFTQGYIEAMFFTSESPQTSTEEFLANCESGDNDGSIPSDVSWWDIAPESLKEIKQECSAFQRDNEKLLDAAIEKSAGEYDLEAAGRDFWYTRNGHGIGYWDRGLEAVGEALSKACGWQTSFPESDVYFGDDGKVYVQ